MPWHELELSVASTDLAEAEALLGLAGAASVSLLGASNDAILEPRPGEAPVWSTVTLRALFPTGRHALAGARAIPERLIVGAPPRCRELDDEDWMEGRIERLEPRNVGHRLRLLAANAEEAPRGRTPVRLNRGLAFGTGEHPTTRLCLEWLDANVTPTTTIVDYGCGSGVLAVAALKLGAAFAWAVDIEPQALTATRENSELNAVEDRLWTGTPELLPNLRTEVLIANILAGPLIALADRFAGLLAPGGNLVLSGILEDQIDDLGRAYGRCFTRFGETRLERWVLLAARRA